MTTDEDRPYLPGLPGMEGMDVIHLSRIKQIKKMINRTYTCPHCRNDPPSVVWDEDARAFFCWACGRNATKINLKLRGLL